MGWILSIKSDCPKIPEGLTSEFIMM